MQFVVVFFLSSCVKQIGPEKGVIHLATAAVLNAVWDLWARAEGKVGYGTVKIRLYELNGNAFMQMFTSTRQHDSQVILIIFL